MMKRFKKYGYCDDVINPIRHINCSCEVKNCWWKAMQKRFNHKLGWFPDQITRKAKTTGPPKVFAIQYSGDIAHPSVPAEYVEQIIRSLEEINYKRYDNELPYHTWLLLTKWPNRLWDTIKKFIMPQGFYFGSSVSNQNTYNNRVLYEMMGHINTWYSVEPMTEPIDLMFDLARGLMPDQVILGGDSTGKYQLDLDWVRSVRDQCAEASVPFFLKQFNDHKLNPELDGTVHDELAWDKYNK